MLKSLFAGAKAKALALGEYRQLVIKIDDQERKVENLRKAKDEAKFNLDIHEATLYIDTKDKTEKVTEAMAKALVEIDMNTQSKRIEAIEAEHTYKLGLVELTRLYNELTAAKLTVQA